MTRSKGVVGDPFHEWPLGVSIRLPIKAVLQRETLLERFILARRLLMAA